MTRRRAFVAFLHVLINLPLCCVAFSNNSHNDDDSSSLPSTLSRRDYWKASFGLAGAVAYAKLTDDALSRVSRGIAYPAAHEQRVESTIASALLSSAAVFSSSSSTTITLDRPFRILEVGVGKDWRVFRRGLYDQALSNLKWSNRQNPHSQGIQIMGVDLKLPSRQAMADTQIKLNAINEDKLNSPTTFDVIVGDVTNELPFADGHFDAIVCCLTLCSVQEQGLALDEICRLVRPNGGTFGYVEHVAVDPHEPYRLLEWQQRALDPLQQALADNCHLHRFTEDRIAQAFDVPNESRTITRERFFVNDMWPVSCQCCGVIQKQMSTHGRVL